MIDADLLRRLRNDLPMPVTIAALGREGPPAKMSEGYFRFVCPRCGEMRATVNPRNNLAHCFCCQKNLNNIDLLLSLDYDFLSAVALLQRWLERYQAQQSEKETADHVARLLKQWVPFPRLVRCHPFATRRTRPTPSRQPSPKFSGIRQTGLWEAKLLTVLIGEQLRSEFGPAHVGHGDRLAKRIDNL